MAETLEKMAERHAAALGRAEAALTFMAAVADQPELVRKTAQKTLADITDILDGKEPK